MTLSNPFVYTTAIRLLVRTLIARTPSMFLIFVCGATRDSWMAYLNLSATLVATGI